MDKETIDLINTGFLKDELVKNVTHYFCKVVFNSCRNNLTEGLHTVKDNLMSFSERHTDSIGVRPVTYSDDILAYFFNQKNEIPGHVYYWLGSLYSVSYGVPSQCKERYYNIYNALQKEYIKRYRTQKADDKDNEQYAKEARRKTCKLFASGEYKAMFELLNKPFLSYMNDKELAAADHITQNLFCQQFVDITQEKPDFDRTAAAFILGRIQGERMAAEKYAKDEAGI